MSIKDHPSSTGLTAAYLVGAACVLGMLYFGRDILGPIAMAGILSLVMTPLVRQLARTGLGRTAATLAAVLLAAGCVVMMTVILASQLTSITGELPQYRTAIQAKITNIRTLAERPFTRLEAELGAVIPQDGVNAARRPAAKPSSIYPQAITTLEPAPQWTARTTVARLLSLVWGPIGQAGVVLVLLIFILLEQESLRDRVVRLAGRAEMSRTMKALGDAAEGVSRFFFSQFIVNTVFGITIGAALWVAGVPHAVLWGTLSGVLRFVPYLGALASGLVIAIFIAAVDAGWWLSLSFLLMFVVIEVLVANFIEPRVYGHSTGLSPLGIIISALFWGALWGPIGLLLSTPLTLCLVVVGRHVRALEPITLLLGEAPALALAERFYQHALAGEADAIVRDARAYLAKNSFAQYCDQILLPGLSLAALDYWNGHIEEAQQERLRAAVFKLMESITRKTEGPSSLFRRKKPVRLLSSSVGAHLRRMRQARLGRWQGSLDVPKGSVVLCAGLQHDRDDLLSELLVYSLRESGIDARSITLDGVKERPDTDKADLVSVVFIVYPLKETYERWLASIVELRKGLPHALLITIRLPFDEESARQSLVGKQVDMVLFSFEEGLAFMTDEHPAHG